MEDGVTSVGKDHCGHIQFLPGLGPEGLEGIHRTAVPAQAEDLAVRTGHRSTCRFREHTPDGSSGSVKPVMGRTTRGEGMKVPSCSNGFIANHRIFRKKITDRSPYRVPGQCSADRFRPSEFLSFRFDVLRSYRFGKLAKPVLNVIFRINELMNPAFLGHEQTWFPGVSEKSDGCFCTCKDQVFERSGHF